jgi:hypothetical protein
MEKQAKKALEKLVENKTKKVIEDSKIIVNFAWSPIINARKYRENFIGKGLQLLNEAIVVINIVEQEEHKK